MTANLYSTQHFSKPYCRLQLFHFVLLGTIPRAPTTISTPVTIFHRWRCTMSTLNHWCRKAVCEKDIMGKDSLLAGKITLILLWRNFKKHTSQTHRMTIKTTPNNRCFSSHLIFKSNIFSSWNSIQYCIEISILLGPLLHCGLFYSIHLSLFYLIWFISCPLSIP